MNGTFDLRSGETHIEVHKFRGGTSSRNDFCADCSGIFAGLFPQSGDCGSAAAPDRLLRSEPPQSFHWIALGHGDWSLARQLEQDPLGLFGIAKTLIGFWRLPSAANWTPNIPSRASP